MTHKNGSLLRALFRGGFIGGLVALLGGFFASTVFGLFAGSLKSVALEDDLSSQIVASVPEAGVYLLPDTRKAPPPDVDMDSYFDGLVLRLQEGPVAFMAIKPDGDQLRPQAKFYTSLILHLLTATCLTLLGWQLREHTYRQRFLLIFLAMLAGGAFVLLTHWNQWYFGWAYTRDALSGFICSWLPATLVVAWATGSGSHFVSIADANP